MWHQHAWRMIFFITTSQAAVEVIRSYWGEEMLATPACQMSSHPLPCGRVRNGVPVHYSNQSSSDWLILQFERYLHKVFWDCRGERVSSQNTPPKRFCPRFLPRRRSYHVAAPAPHSSQGGKAPPHSSQGGKAPTVSHSPSDRAGSTTSTFSPGGEDEENYSAAPIFSRRSSAVGGISCATLPPTAELRRIHNTVKVDEVEQQKYDEWVRRVQEEMMWRGPRGSGSVEPVEEQVVSSPGDGSSSSIGGEGKQGPQEKNAAAWSTSSPSAAVLLSATNTPPANSSTAEASEPGRYQPLIRLLDRSPSTGNWTVREEDDGYEARSNTEDSRCENWALWSADTRGPLSCVLWKIGVMFGLDERSSVLEWGSGCGHNLAFLKAKFRVGWGVGVELSETAHDYAVRTYGAPPSSQPPPRGEGATTEEPEPLLFCRQNGVDLANFPSDTFELVYSYAALYHLDPTAQCDVLHQMVRLTKVQGHVWIGWHAETPMTWAPQSCRRWRDCLALLWERTKIQAEMIVCMPELCVFGRSAYDSTHDTVIIRRVG